METLEGLIERITFFNPENGYTVLRLKIKGRVDPVTVVGNLPELAIGESLRLHGRWANHATYGRQFLTEKCEQVLPATIEGIRRYLGSGLIKGIGPRTADKIVDTFGRETLYVIDTQPQRLREVPDIGQKRYRIITEAWQTQKAIKEVMVFLQGHGISAGLAIKVYKQYGDSAIGVVQSDPYRLARDIWGIGFKTADKIARALGLPPDAPSRLEAGLVFALSELADEGHTFAPQPELLNQASTLLEIPPESLLPALNRLVTNERLRRDRVAAHEAIYLPSFLHAEAWLAMQLKRLLNTPARPLQLSLTRFEADLSPEQLAAVHMAMESKVSVLTGGPGTGKCLTGDALVLTPSGLQPLANHWGDNDLCSDTFQEHVVEVVSKDSLAETSHAYYGGVQKTVRIRTQLGLELEGTPNHRIWAMTEHGADWMRLDEIKPNSYVAIRRGDNVWGQAGLDPDLAYVLGVISGDGSQSSSRLLQIANSSLPLLQQCQEVLERSLGGKGSISSSRNTYNLRFHGSQFRNRLSDFGLQVCKSDGKTVPTAVLRSGRDSVVRYLAGLFDTDGHIQHRSTGQVCFEITLKSVELIKQVQLLLLNLGIISRRAPKTIKYKMEDRTYWRLSVFGHDVDLLMANIPTLKAREPQQRQLNTNRDIVPLPGNILRHIFLFNGPRNRREWWAWKREIKGERRPTRPRLLSLLDEIDPAQETWQMNALKEASRECHFWDRIGEIGSSSANVYDLTVPGEESFVANGFVNHNTTTLRALILALEKTGRRYALASPTGRAAKRLAQATGREAKTIHRLLGYSPDGTYKHDEDHPLDVDMLVVDETSMLDLILAYHLLKAVPATARVLLVGDVDQLPSVGAGDVLRDIIRSGRVPVARLTSIFRQAEGSGIIQNAHRIIHGQMPIFNKNVAEGGDFFLFEQSEETEVAKWVVDVVANRVPARFSLDPLRDVIVLSPMYRGAAGVGALNEALQAVLNPPAPDKAEKTLGGRTFRVGDRVMQLRNNYTHDVYNGDIGQVTRIDLETQQLEVNFEGTWVEYDWTEVDEITHAYAASVHKVQGSEHPAVVLALLPRHYMLLQRNLLYTAVTRAQKLCVIVGSRRAIGMAVNNDKVAQRWSGLEERLKAE